MYKMMTNNENWPVRGRALTQPWHIQMCDICSVVTWLLRDMFICVSSTSSCHAWLVTHSDVWHLLICDMPHSWHIHVCDTYSFVTCLARDTFRCVTSTRSWHDLLVTCSYVWYLHTWLVTHSDVSHLLIWDMTHPRHIYRCSIWYDVYTITKNHPRRMRSQTLTYVYSHIVYDNTISRLLKIIGLFCKRAL